MTAKAAAEPAVEFESRGDASLVQIESVYDYDALVVVGGQSPMFTFRDHQELKNAVKAF